MKIHRKVFTIRGCEESDKPALAFKTSALNRSCAELFVVTVVFQFQYRASIA